MTSLYHIPACKGMAEALSILALRFGRAISPEGISHGLSLDAGRLSPVSFGDAATRAGLTLHEVDIAAAKSVHCPLLVLNPDGRALVIIELKPGGLGQAISDAGEQASVLVAGLAAAGFVLAWSVRPLEQRDGRTEPEAKQDFGWFKEALWIGNSALLPVVAATIAINLLSLAVPLISMNILDRVVSHAAFETLWALSLGGILAIAFDFVLRTLRGTLIDHASARSDVLLSNGIFARVLGARLTGKPSSVGVQTNSLREYESIREIYNSAAITTFGDLPFALLFFFVIWLVAGPLVIVPLAATPVLLGAGFAIQWRLGKLSAAHFKDIAHKNAVAVEVMSGLQTLKTHTAESWAAFKWETAVAGHLRHSIDIRWWTAMSSNIVVALQGVTTIAILVLGVYLVVGGAISPGALFATTMLTGRSLTPVVQLSSLLSKLHQAKSAYHAIRQLADVEQERPPEVEFLDCPARFEGMTLSGVGLTYRAGIPPALTNVSITIGRGEKVGIFGGIGSGKSTLLQLIMGLRTPSEGTITMAGRPIHQVDPIQYRRLFGAAFQDEAFFYGTIHENITFHRPRSSESEIVDAARQSGAMDWIKQVPAGFASIISEAGRSLSSGQRQTLVLARAFLGSPDVILLDEPTSNLDARSESELVRRLKQLPAETTLIAVSHRPAVFDACDRLIVLDGGNLLMDGEKAVVLARLKQAARSRRGAQEAVS